jgi:hypothetical protein
MKADDATPVVTTEFPKAFQATARGESLHVTPGAVARQVKVLEAILTEASADARSLGGMTKRPVNGKWCRLV